MLQRLADFEATVTNCAMINPVPLGQTRREQLGR